MVAGQLLAPHPAARATFIGRRSEFDRLRQYFERGGRFASVIGAPGVGKTSFALMFASHARGIFGGAISYVHANPAHRPNPPQNRTRPHLTVVDDAESLSDSTLAELHAEFERLPLAALLIVRRGGYSERIARDYVVKLAPLKIGEVIEHFRMELPAFGDTTIERVIERLGGNAYLVAAAIAQLREGRTWRDIEASLSAFRYAGVLGPDGRPVSAAAIQRLPLIVDVAEVNAHLLNVLHRNPAAWYDLSPRKFEQIVAELLASQGYVVTLSPEGADGGFDIYAARREGLGEFLFLVECKRYTPPRKVGVQIVRALRGILDEQRAVGAAVVTTSYFTGPAQAYQSKFQHQLKLHDYVALQRWLASRRNL